MMKKGEIIAKLVLGAAILWICFVGYKLITQQVPTHTDTILERQSTYDSLRIADLQQSVDNLLRQVEESRYKYDSLKRVQNKLRNTYQNEINSITLLPWSERIRLHQDYLNKPDTAFWD